MYYNCPYWNFSIATKQRKQTTWFSPFDFSEFYHTVPDPLLSHRHPLIHAASMSGAKACRRLRRHVEDIAAVPGRRHRSPHGPGLHRHLQYSRRLLDVRLLQVCAVFRRRTINAETGFANKTNLDASDYNILQTRKRFLNAMCKYSTMSYWHRDFVIIARLCRCNRFI